MSGRLTTIMRHANNTVNEMLATGQWTKLGKRHFGHVSGREIKHDGQMWTVGERRYDALWIAKMVVESEAAS